MADRVRPARVAGPLAGWRRAGTTPTRRPGRPRCESARIAELSHEPSRGLRADAVDGRQQGATFCDRQRALDVALEGPEAPAQTRGLRRRSGPGRGRLGVMPADRAERPH